MSFKINLLKQKKNKARERKTPQNISFFSYFLLTVIFLFTVSAYLYHLILLRQTSALAGKIENYKTSIDGYKELEEKKSILNEQLSKISQIYKERVDFTKGMEEIENILPFGIIRKEMTLEESGRTDIKVMAKSSAEIEKFVENLNSLKEQGLTRATLVSLSRGKEGSYDISLSLEIPKKEEGE